MEKEFLEEVTAHQGIIHKVCGLYYDRQEDRKDLFQEIILQLWKAYPTFRGEAKLTTWMYRIALNTAISHYRKDRRVPYQSAITEQDFERADYLPDQTEEQIQYLHQAIGQLSRIEKAIVMLYLEGKPYEEIAEIVSITPNYVRVKMNRIRNKLKTIVTKTSA